MADNSEVQQIAKLQADVRNLCRSVDDVRATVGKIDEKLDEHRLLSAERSSQISTTVYRVDDHECRIKKLESSFIRFALYVALSAGGVTFGIDKIISIFK